MTSTYSRDWVYQRLICEFDHWDVCLVGLIDNDGRKQVCRALSSRGNPVRSVMYTIHDIRWDSVCDEYLADYRVSYPHWFYVDGQRECHYDGRDLSWFEDRWQHRNPILERQKR